MNISNCRSRRAHSEYVYDMQHDTWQITQNDKTTYNEFYGNNLEKKMINSNKRNQVVEKHLIFR